MTLAHEAALSAQWAMEEAALRSLLDIAARDHDTSPQALEAYRARRLEAGERARIRDGVAILSVEGPLFKRANLFTEMSGATSYELLRRDLQAAIEDSSVSAILLDVDSPGGEALGTAELAEAIYEARGSKPITAYVGGMGASAAYWIASAADEVVANKSAILGSIGVRMAMRDTSEREKRDGVKTYTFVSSQSPYKAADPESEAGRARIQRTVDSLATVFVEAVARNRGVDVETVVENYGGGDVLVGVDAVEAGLADRLGDFEETLARMASDGTGETPGIAVGTGGANAHKGDTSMSEDTEKPVAAPAITAEHVAANHPDVAEHFRAEGAQAERDRITKIRSLTYGGHEALAEKAIESGSTAEAFAVQMAEAEKARGKAHLSAIEGDEKGLEAPEPSAETDEGDDVDKTAASIVAAASFNGAGK